MPNNNQFTNADYYAAKARESERKASANLRLAAERATEIDELRKQLSDMGSELIEAGNEIDLLESVNASLKVQIEKLQSDFDKMRAANIEELKDDIGQLFALLEESPDVARDIVDGFRKMYLGQHKMIMCSHCGWSTDNHDPDAAHERMLEHLHVCEKNPVVAENKKLRKALLATQKWAAEDAFEFDDLDAILEEVRDILKDNDQ